MDGIENESDYNDDVESGIRINRYTNNDD